jgi:prephenate dehydrogenase
MIQSRAMNLGIIGFGRFGEFTALQLRNSLRVLVWDVRDLRKRAAALGVTWGTLREVASASFVLVAVPVAELNAALDEVVPYLDPGALLMDGCSVKVKPVQWMTERAPENVEVIGLHALFGPQSARAGLAGQKIVVCPARSRRVELLERFLRDLGLSVLVTTPEEHDRAMAHTQALTQFLARGLIRAGLEERILTTPAFNRLRGMVEMVRHDSVELFQDMHRFNPYAAEERRKVLEALLQIHRHLESLPRGT